MACQRVESLEEHVHASAACGVSKSDDGREFHVSSLRARFEPASDLEAPWANADEVEKRKAAFAAFETAKANPLDVAIIGQVLEQAGGGGLRPYQTKELKKMLDKAIQVNEVKNEARRALRAHEDSAVAPDAGGLEAFRNAIMHATAAGLEADELQASWCGFMTAHIDAWVHHVSLKPSRTAVEHLEHLIEQGKQLNLDMKKAEAAVEGPIRCAILTADISTAVADVFARPTRGTLDHLERLLRAGAELKLDPQTMSLAMAALDTPEVEVERCGICLETPEMTFQMPCCRRASGSAWICDPCFAKVIETSNECPYCRAPQSER